MQRKRSKPVARKVAPYREDVDVDYRPAVARLSLDLPDDSDLNIPGLDKGYVFLILATTSKAVGDFIRYRTAKSAEQQRDARVAYWWLFRAKMGDPRSSAALGSLEWVCMALNRDVHATRRRILSLTIGDLPKVDRRRE